MTKTTPTWADEGRKEWFGWGGGGKRQENEEEGKEDKGFAVNQELRRWGPAAVITTKEKKKFEIRFTKTGR